MPKRFHDRYFPVRPNLDQLRHQAKDLLRAIRKNDAAAVAELRKHNPKAVEPTEAKLADAQFALARSYSLPNNGRYLAWGHKSPKGADPKESAFAARSGPGIARQQLGSPDVVCGQHRAGRNHSDAARDGSPGFAARLRPSLPAGADRNRPRVACDGSAAGARLHDGTV